MCLAIPGRIESIFEKDGLSMARVDFGGVKRVTCLQYVPDALPGNYVLVHVGFAINIVNEDEAVRTLELLKSLGEEFPIANEPIPIDDESTQDCGVDDFGNND